MTPIVGRSLCAVVFGAWLNAALALDTNNCAGGIVYGDRWAFVVVAPDGWCMVLKSGLSVNAAFFQIKSKTTKEIAPSTAAPPTFMYLTSSVKNQSDPDLESLMTHDEEAFRRTSPNLKITKMSPLNTVDKKPAQVMKFEGIKGGRCEIVAYKSYDARMYKIVVSAPTCKELGLHRDSFAKLVGSFADVKDGVQFKGSDK